jgi:3-oxoacyl-[acyl-carrier-protein] synthase II
VSPSSAVTEPVVTGTGAVTPYGRGVSACWDGLAAGRSAVAPIRSFAADDLAPARAAEVPREPRDPDGAAAFLLIAAAEALAGAGLAPDAVRPDRIGIVVGTTLGGIRIFEGWLGGPGAAGPPAAIPYFAAAGRLADAVGATGPVVTTQLACASGTAAVGMGARWIREGRCDVVLSGGADVLCRYVVAGFNCLRATAEEARPFDAARRGLVLGEGAAVLVLESAAHAARRGAPVRARLTGDGAAADAVHMTAPDRQGRGAAAAIRQALARAGREPASIGFVSAHGTGTPYNDAMEAQALGAVFGAHRRVPVNSVKGAIGHTLGAAGAIEAVLCVEVLERGVVPATIGLEEVAPECAALDLVMGAPRGADVRACVSTSSGFAGANAAIVLERA